jgi:hypothetical protein
VQEVRKLGGAEIQDYLNQIFGEQANLKFVVIAPPTVPESVHYDLNGDNQITNPKFNTGEPLNSADLQEAATIHSIVVVKRYIGFYGHLFCSEDPSKWKRK